MPRITILCWQEIPSAVEVRDAGRTVKIALTPRFMELIDAAAMRRKLTGSDDYLAQWRRERRPDREGNPQEIARTLADEIEARFEEIRADALAQGPG